MEATSPPRSNGKRPPAAPQGASIRGALSRIRQPRYGGNPTVEQVVAEPGFDPRAALMDDGVLDLLYVAGATAHLVRVP